MQYFFRSKSRLNLIGPTVNIVPDLVAREDNWQIYDEEASKKQKLRIAVRQEDILTRTWKCARKPQHPDPQTPWYRLRRGSRRESPIQEMAAASRWKMAPSPSPPSAGPEASDELNKLPHSRVAAGISSTRSRIQSPARCWSPPRSPGPRFPSRQPQILILFSSLLLSSLEPLHTNFLWVPRWWTIDHVWPCFHESRSCCFLQKLVWKSHNKYTLNF